MSTPSTIDPNETIESVLMRAPSCSLVTPKATKRAHIRPLKRVKFAEGDAGSTKEEEEPDEEQEEEEKREALEPRRLDMDQHVVLANPSSSDEEDEQAAGTQRVAEEEEGELPPEPQKSEPEEH
jgi:hypothetical protein